MRNLDFNLEGVIQNLKSGDETAFDELYEMTYRKIYFVVLPILRDKSLSEDIIQETYLKFLEKLYDYKSKNSLAYILTIARNLAINEYNKRKRIVKIDTEEMSQFGYDQFLEISAEKEELIHNALSVLDDLEKNVFLLHTIENMKHKEIALVLNKPLGTITWVYQKAIRKMRKHIEDI